MSVVAASLMKATECVQMFGDSLAPKELDSTPAKPEPTA
jgi:hypothetical protein